MSQWLTLRVSCLYMILNMERQNTKFKHMHKWPMLLMEFEDRDLNMVLQNWSLEVQMVALEFGIQDKKPLWLVSNQQRVNLSNLIAGL